MTTGTVGGLDIGRGIGIAPVPYGSSYPKIASTPRLNQSNSEDPQIDVIESSGSHLSKSDT